jgi:hypothetical protein
VTLLKIQIPIPRSYRRRQEAGEEAIDRARREHWPRTKGAEKEVTAPKASAKKKNPNAGTHWCSGIPTPLCLNQHSPSTKNPEAR